MITATQDDFLGKLIANRTPVCVYLINGIKLVGSVTGFDQFSMVLAASGVDQLVYKHGIASIVPQAVREKRHGESTARA